MTRRMPQWDRRTTLGQAIIPAALLALVALVGALTWQAHRSDASQRAMAETALRDYAGFAAWQYSRDAADFVNETARNTLNTLMNQGLFRGRVDRTRLIGPERLARFGSSMACGIGSEARFAFRLDLPGGDLHLAGDDPGEPTRRAIIERFTALAPQKVSRPGTPIRLVVDTLGGVPRAIAYAVIRLDDEPLAVYGVEAAPEALLDGLRSIARNRPLLPPSLVQNRPLDSLFALEVRRADGGLLLALGDAPGSRLSASHAMHADDGALTTTVTLHAGTAGLLLIGGMPATRLPMHGLLLAASIALAGMALLQLRRGRDLARLRTRFVANVSHELRTPLAQISMFSETLLLERERSPDERQQFLSVIFREARRLSHLVESVLSFSRAEAGPRTLRPEPRDVGADVRDAVHAFAPLAESAGVDLRVSGDDEAWALVEPCSLRQVLVNLLDNAVKFGPEGQRVTVHVAHGERHVQVAVDDEGPGIPVADRRRLFEPFTQGEHVRMRTGSGAGIGLAVVAELVSAHGGHAWIEDAPGGRGARVVFTLPAVATGPRDDDWRDGEPEDATATMAGERGVAVPAGALAFHGAAK
ncbi:MAG TPA: HAMP domain-containing sensor histidine kinase [Gemmatimonadaceae bacterium]|nr:HAMP domain-containing sensor histidine kinase [Gemmatimonadaceae bacterium]